MIFKHKIYSVLAFMLMLMTAACSPESESLGEIDLTQAQINEGQGFTISVDQNTNYVTFESKLPANYSVYWEYGTQDSETGKLSVAGSSTDRNYSVGIAFPGSYSVRMGVMTRGGIIFSAPASFTLDNMNANLISDPLWTMLTGGVGKSKTWVLDLDPNDGSALKFGGPKWFYTTGQCWDSFHNASGENYLDADPWDPATAIDPTKANEWYWAADWAGNGWICGLADYGEMTFDLINGANVNVNGTKGSFNMDAAAHTIQFTGVLPLSCGVEGSIAAQCPAGNYKIIYLTENAMQILFDGDSETPFTMNYISKEYKENYVAPVITTITLPEGWRNYIEPFNQKTTKYKFVDDDPFGWFTLAGEQIARSGFGPNANITEASFEFNSESKSLKIVDINGDEHTATYDLDDNGKFHLSSLPTFPVSDNENIKFANRNNDLQIIKYEIDDMSGDISELWLGSLQYDDQGNAYEYLAYHLKKQTGGEEKEAFKVNLGLSDSGWNFITYEPVYVTGEGTYTWTLTPDGICNTQDPYLYFIDVYKLLKKYPNADITITSVKADGVEKLGTMEGFDDETISRGGADSPDDGRRYLLNPWNEVSVTHTPLFQFSNTLEVTVKIVYDCGEKKL